MSASVRALSEETGVRSASVWVLVSAVVVKAGVRAVSVCVCLDATAWEHVCFFKSSFLHKSFLHKGQGTRIFLWTILVCRRKDDSCA